MDNNYLLSFLAVQFVQIENISRVGQVEYLYFSNI